MQNQIEAANRDIEDYRKLIDFLTVYHGQVAISKFKSEKAKNYLKLIHQYSAKEISNSIIHIEQLMQLQQEFQLSAFK